ncbi:MAG: WD40 repeat domain-containing protein [Planctomycetes bacterium]|nr:WD40 repeat domain-containing protein [Planctomycetota bacterium]
MLRICLLSACLLSAFWFTQEDDAIAPLDTTGSTIKRYTEGESRAPSFVLLHEKPVSGQYWETGSDSHGMTSSVRWQVTSIQGDLALIEQRITMKADTSHSDFVLAYRVNLKAEAGKGNVTAAWIGRPKQAPQRVKVIDAVPPAAAELEDKGEDFDGLELAGSVWRGKLYTRKSNDLTLRRWVAEGGWFDSTVKTTAGDYLNLLKACGGDGDPIMLWPKVETWHTDVPRPAEKPAVFRQKWQFGGKDDNKGLRCMTPSPDGKQVLVVSISGPVSLLDAETGKELRKFEGHEGSVLCAAFSPDGKRVMTGGMDRTSRLWEVASGKELRKFDGLKEEVISVAISPDGKRALATGLNFTGVLWDVENGTELHRFPMHWIGVFSPDGGQVLASGAPGCGSWLWDAESGEQLREFTGNSGVGPVTALSSDGKRVLTAGLAASPELWDAETGKELRKFEGHEKPSTSLAFSPDGKLVLSASWDQTARLWDAETGRLLKTFTGHTDRLESAAFSPDGKKVLTSGDDGTARLWDVETGQELHKFADCPKDIAGPAAVFMPDSKRILVHHADGTLRLWD